MKSLKEQLKSALYISAATFLIGLAIVVFSKSPRFGFFLVSAYAVGVVVNVTYGVFALLMSTSMIQNIVESRKRRRATTTP
jgi:heme exporter protein D